MRPSDKQTQSTFRIDEIEWAYRNMDKVRHGLRADYCIMPHLERVRVHRVSLRMRRFIFECLASAGLLMLSIEPGVARPNAGTLSRFHCKRQNT